MYESRRFDSCHGEQRVDAVCELQQQIWRVVNWLSGLIFVCAVRSVRGRQLSVICVRVLYRVLWLCVATGGLQTVVWLCVATGGL